MNYSPSSISDLSSSKSHHIIAIDGPAASGKSSVARAIAENLGFLFVSSGHFYRALAWLAINRAFDFSNEESLPDLSEFQENRIDNRVHLFFEGKDLTNYLHDPEVISAVSPLSALPNVRNIVTSKLHTLADSSNLVVEGRDIGSVVFPNTPWKFYLDASPEERARRRAKKETLDSITQRDRQDSTRTLAPLIIPEGALTIDTTHLTIAEVVEKILEQLTLTQDKTSLKR